MNVMAVDTLSIARELRAAEFPSPQAEAIAAAIGRASTDSLETAATKADIAQLAAATKADLAHLAAATKADIAQLATATKADIAHLEAKVEAVQGKLIMWFVSSQLAVGAPIVALIKL